MRRAVAAILLAIGLVFTASASASAKTKAPASCLKAIKDSRRVFRLQSELDGHTAEFFQKLHDAGADPQGTDATFIAALSDAVGPFLTQIKDANAQMSPLLDDFARQSAKCEAGK